MTRSRKRERGPLSKRAGHERTLETASWGLFLVWLGVAWLAQVPLGLTLLGIAAITLGAQGVRRRLRLEVQGFWLLAGACFAIAGLWTLLDAGTALVPVLVTFVGAALIVALLRRIRRQARR